MLKLNNWDTCFVTITFTTLALFNAPWLPLIKNHAQGAKVRAGHKNKTTLSLAFWPYKNAAKIGGVNASLLQIDL
jgi:hypothetical protein